MQSDILYVYCFNLRSECKMKYILLTVLMVATGFLIYLGIKHSMQPPIWTGIGFIAIAGLFLQKEK